MRCTTSAASTGAFLFLLFQPAAMSSGRSPGNGPKANELCHLRVNGAGAVQLYQADEISIARSALIGQCRTGTNREPSCLCVWTAAPKWKLAGRFLTSAVDPRRRAIHDNLKRWPALSWPEPLLPLLALPPLSSCLRPMQAPRPRHTHLAWAS